MASERLSSHSPRPQLWCFLYIGLSSLGSFVIACVRAVICFASSWNSIGLGDYKTQFFELVWHTQSCSFFLLERSVSTRLTIRPSISYGLSLPFQYVPPIVGSKIDQLNRSNQFKSQIGSWAQNRPWAKSYSVVSDPIEIGQVTCRKNIR